MHRRSFVFFLERSAFSECTSQSKCIVLREREVKSNTTQNRIPLGADGNLDISSRQ